MTIANMALAQKAAERLDLTPRFTIIGFGADIPSYSAGTGAAWLQVDGKFMASRSGFRAALDQLDCVLDIGAGDSFSDIYGLKRFAYLWISKYLALAKRKPLLLSPQTIGPFSNAVARRMAGWAMQRADLVVARDSLSFEEVRRIAPRARPLQSTDVAFGLPYDQAPKNGTRIRIGLNVSGMLFNDAVRQSKRYELGYDYSKFARYLLQELTKADRYQVELISHVSSASESIDDDTAVAERLGREYPALCLAPRFASPSEAKSYISGLDFLIAGRMHACVAAFSSGVPFVATAYSRKFEGLFGAFGYPAILPQDTGTIDLAVAAVLQWVDRRGELAETLTIQNGKVAGLLRAYEDALVDFFSKVASR